MSRRFAAAPCDAQGCSSPAEAHRTHTAAQEEQGPENRWIITKGEMAGVGFGLRCSGGLRERSHGFHDVELLWHAARTELDGLALGASSDALTRQVVKIDLASGNRLRSSHLRGIRNREHDDAHRANRFRPALTRAAS